MDLKKIDWTVLRKYTSLQAIKDLDRFLDAVPMAVGYNALIAAGMACLLAGTAVFFTSVETGKISKMHADLFQIQALQPPIPILQYMPVAQEVLKTQADKIMSTYKGISILVNSAGSAVITAHDTDYFPQFLAAVSYLQRGGKNWKVMIDTFCVGRDCPASKLTANLRIEMVRFGEPVTKMEKK